MTCPSGPIGGIHSRSEQFMKISSAVFYRSAPDLNSCPDESPPEFAFIGRSNFGKSSLLNMLAGKTDLALVSPTPGFTKLNVTAPLALRWESSRMKRSSLSRMVACQVGGGGK